MQSSPISRCDKLLARPSVSDSGCQAEYTIVLICYKAPKPFSLLFPTFHYLFENSHTRPIRIFNRLPALPQAALGDPNGATSTSLIQLRTVNERGVPRYLPSTPTSSMRYKF